MKPSVVSPPVNAPMQSRPVALALAVLALLVIATGCTSSAAEPESESTEPSEVDSTRPRDQLLPAITLGVTDWTGARLNVAIAEQLIERRLGYPVEPAPVLDTAGMLRDVAGGELDAVLELWPSALDDENRAVIDAGRVEDLGPLGVDGKAGWFIPRYVLDTYPELTSWEPLASADVAAAFATAETGGRGRFLGTDSNDEQFDEEIITELDLPFDVVFSGSDEATVAELADAEASSRPILLFWWTPTAEAARFDLVNVALPERTTACEEAIGDGQAQGCDYPADRLFKIGAPDLAASAPDVHRFLTEFSITTAEQLAMIDEVENGGRSIDSVAADWIAEHQDRWQAWLS